MALSALLPWAIVSASSAVCTAATAAPAGENPAQVIAGAPTADQRPAVTPSPSVHVEAASFLDFMLLAVAVAALLIFFLRRWYRLPSPPIRPQTVSPLAGFALYLAQYGAGVIGAAIAWQYFIRTGDDLGIGKAFSTGSLTFQQQIGLQIGSYVGQLAVAAVYGWFVFTALRALKRIGWRDQRPGRIQSVMLGAGALLLAWPVAQTVGAGAALVQQWFTDKAISPIAHETLKEMVERQFDHWFVIEAVLVIAVAPVIEEVLYRGIFQETLRRLGVPSWWAILGTSVFFASMHLSIAQPNAIAALFVLSLGFGWIYEKTGRLSANIAMHALFNAGNLAMALLLSPHTAAVSMH